VSSLSMLVITCFSYGVRKVAVSGYYNSVQKHEENKDMVRLTSGIMK